MVPLLFFYLGCFGMKANNAITQTKTEILN